MISILICVLGWTVPVILTVKRLRKLPNRSAIFKSALRIGLWIGVCRAVGGSLGLYMVEGPYGILQVLGYWLMVVSVWPDAFLLVGIINAIPKSKMFPLLFVCLIPTTLSLVFVAAALAIRWPRRRSA